MTQKTWGFFITTYCTELYQLNICLTSCVESLIKFHPDKMIVIVDDFSPIDTNVFSKYENVQWIQPPYKCAEMGGYVSFLENKYFDVAVSFHDSVKLLKPLPENIIDIDCKTFWSFHDFVEMMTGFNSDERLTFEYLEPTSKYNEENDIKTSDDLIFHLVEKYCPDCEFKEYFECMFEQKRKWLGSVGMMLIISHDFLLELEAKTHILEIAKGIAGNRRQRMAMEQIIGVAIKYVKRWTKWEDYCFDIDFTYRSRELGNSCFNNYAASEYIVKCNQGR